MKREEEDGPQETERSLLEEPENFTERREQPGETEKIDKVAESSNTSEIKTPVSILRSPRRHRTAKDNDSPPETVNRARRPKKTVDPELKAFLTQTLS